MPRLTTLLLILLAILQPSCSMRPVALHLADYPKLPTARTSLMLRALVDSNQFMRSRALWGNYGGPGDVGGVPIDPMDELFLQHDLAYLQGVKRRELLAADRRLISQLGALDAEDLSPAADNFRRRAMRYFSRPTSRVVGKPPDVLFGWKRAPAVIDISGSDK